MEGKSERAEAPVVDVVTLTWNDGERLQRSIEATLGSENVGVVLTVVDNGSILPL